MSGPALELQKAVFSALAGDTALVAALGGERVFDRPPADTPFPYISFGSTSGFDWSTGTESGDKLLFTLHVWSKARGKAETLAIMELARRALEDQPPVLAAGHLVSLELDYLEARLDEELAVHHGLLRYRALVER